MTKLVEHFEGDPEAVTPGRQVVRHIGQSLVKAMEMALKAGGPPEAAQLVAAECVVHAETKDHLNWELLGEAARALKGEDAKAVKEALQASGGAGGRAPLSHHGLEPRAVDRVAGASRGPAAARGGEGRQDGDRGGAGEEGSSRDAVTHLRREGTQVTAC